MDADTNNVTDLYLTHRKREGRRLRVAFQDGFYAGGNWITFARGADGRVTGFTWSSGRVRKVRFVKK